MRERVLILAIAVGVYATLVTEVLGAVHALSRWPLIAAWAVATLLFLPSLLGRGWGRVRPLQFIHATNGAIPSPGPSLEGRGGRIVFVIVLALPLLATLYLALACPPNNFDVILYHLPRQVQWLQQQSVAHFPTQDYRLTVNPPLAEYLQCHLMAIFDTDRLQALVSWAAYVLTIVAVSLLPTNRKAQCYAALAAAYVPMAIHEAASGKNDVVVALWYITAVWCLKAEKPFTLGVVVGLLVLTKGTGAIFGAPIVVLAFWKQPRTSPLRKQGRENPPLLALRADSRSRLLLGLACGAALNLPHAYRNVVAYGSPAGQTFGLDNASHKPKQMLSVFIRNVAMHAALPNDAWNQRVERAVVWLHDRLGIDVCERETTWGVDVFRVEYQPRREQCTAPIHGLLIVIAMAVSWRRCEALILLTSFLLFCIAFKWQPWHPRLHVPLLMLGCTLIGDLLARWRWSWLIIGLMIVTAWPAIFQSEYRPIPLGMFLRYHGSSKGESFTKSLVDMIPESNVDLINHGADALEYPLTRELKRGHNRHVGYFYPVAGSPPAAVPDVVIYIRGEPPAQLRHASGDIFVLDRNYGPYATYKPGAAIPGEGFETAVGRFGIGAEPLKDQP